MANIRGFPSGGKEGDIIVKTGPGLADYRWMSPEEYVDTIRPEKLLKLTLGDLPMGELTLFMRQLIGESEMAKVQQAKWERELAEFRFVREQALEVLLRDGWTADEAREVLRTHPDGNR